MNPGTRKNNLFDVLWDFFASIKLTVVVLILLAATSVFGTLIPQNADPAAYIRAYGEFAYRMMVVFDLFDMYYSWWFQALIAVLVVNIIVCTAKRWPAIWKIVSAKSFPIGTMQKKKPMAEFSDGRPPKKLDTLYQKAIQKKISTRLVESEDGGFQLIVEKGRWTRLGVPVVHLSIVIVLAGALTGSFFGFDGFVNIPEGASADRIQLRNSSAILPLGFEVRCDDFDVSFYDTGSPKEFRSSLVILEDGQEVGRKDIIVNDPLRYKGVNFFQSSYGLIPPKNVTLNFTFVDTGETLQRDVSMGQSLDMPDGGGRFTLREYNHDFRFRSTEVGAAVMGVLEKPGKEPIGVALPLRFPSFDKMRKGDWFISVAELEEAYYTGLQVTRDPGVPLVYTGFILLILGCWVTFFMSHQKVVIDVQPCHGSSQIRMYGSTNRNHLGFKAQMEKLENRLKNL
jgi:cytochrome c biogenesis protein